MIYHDRVSYTPRTEELIRSISDLGAASKCLQTLLNMPEYQRARSLSVYLSMPTGEIGTEDVVKHAFQNSKGVYVPLTYKLSQHRNSWPSSIMDMVELHSWEDFTTLKRDKWGIPSPSKDSLDRRRNCFGGLGKSEGAVEREPIDDELDFIIMPGLAFDRRLERIGHGKGYYDFFLQRYLWHTQKLNVKMPFLGKAYLNCHQLSLDTC
jgi:5-formyltetrahydrofolate cyclo-ligase